ncbi:MAG TPA: hypothetical protein VFX15_00585 [Actinomycetes bacterium]|nr:hypothetical protein [Actinomycetes bacterium]
MSQPHPDTAGWYPSERAGFVQFHDGTRWTGEYFSTAASSGTTAASPQAPQLSPQAEQSTTDASRGACQTYRFAPAPGSLGRVLRNAAKYPLVVLVVGIVACVTELFLESHGWFDSGLRDRSTTIAFIVALAGYGVVVRARRAQFRWAASFLTGLALGFFVAVAIQFAQLFLRLQ